MALATKAALGIAAGVCGTLFLGYCVYFDHKRRSDPNFKRKLKNKRKQAKLNKGPSTEPSIFQNTESLQAFFFQQAQLGDEAMSRGDYETAVEHLCAAVAVCNQPQQLLGVLQQSMPRQAYSMLLERLPVFRQHIISRSNQSRSLLADDELE